MWPHHLVCSCGVDGAVLPGAAHPFLELIIFILAKVLTQLLRRDFNNLSSVDEIDPPCTVVSVGTAEALYVWTSGGHLNGSPTHTL